MPADVLKHLSLMAELRFAAPDNFESAPTPSRMSYIVISLPLPRRDILKSNPPLPNSKTTRKKRDKVFSDDRHHWYMPQLRRRLHP
jgi:hypothetical protein